MDNRTPAKPAMFDPLIIPRVKQYLEENVHQTYVDVGVMARHLQEKYREYQRRKALPFRQLVDQAYKIVLQSYGLDSNPSSDEDENSDCEITGERALTSGNQMNNMLTNMYGTGTSSVDKEPIDISSDDDDAEKSNNGEVAKTKSDTTKQNAESTTTVTAATDAPLNHPKKRKIESRQNSVAETNSTTAQSNAVNASAPSTKLNKSAFQLSKKSRKEYPVVISTLNFERIGGVDKILKELCELLMHIKHPNVYKHVGLPPPRGFLLHGPPGCGKTLLAQAIAGQLQVGLIEVAGTELIGGVSGESEERIRDLFDQAAAVAPCVLFIDEIDAISSNRQNAQKDMERRIVAQLLLCLDGLSKQQKGDQVLVIGATNRADTLDPALRRVGRFDQEICLGIPDRDARCQILRVICSDLRLERMFDYDAIAALTPGYVGADLLALATRAASVAVKRVFHDKHERLLLKSIPTRNAIPSSIPDVNLNDEILMELDSIEPQEGIDIGESRNEIENVTETEKVEDEGVLDEKPAENADKASEENEKSNETEAVEMKQGEGESLNTSTSSDKKSSVESLADAMLKNSAIKQQMGLDVMVKWLSNVEPLVTEDELLELYITMNDFNEAIKVVQPSAKREGFITVPDVTWNDIGSLHDIRQELSLAVLAPVKFPHQLKKLGLDAPSGVLLCGPPGCGKTLLAKAIANEAGINFISVKGPELLNMYVGESERAVRQCFQRARNSAPCVIFFDEFDALCPKRSSGSESSASSRVVNQLLTEMDGVEERKGVFLMAATNRPDMIDPAVLRPGRLDKILYVGLPDQNDRQEILQALTKEGSEPTLAEDVKMDELATRTDSFTGADLAGLVRQASLQALKEWLAKNPSNDSNEELRVAERHFDAALKHLRPSVSPEDKIRYEKLRLKYAVAPEQ